MENLTAEIAKGAEFWKVFLFFLSVLRALEVLRLIAAGLSNREIAETLVIALSTAKNHVRNVYGKLDVHSRTQAVARAKELGLL